MNFVCFVPEADINGLATDVKTGTSPPALQREDEAGETRIEVAGSSTLGPYGVNQIDYLTGKSDRSARDSFLYYSGKDPSAVRYKNWKMYFAMVSDAPAGFITGVVPYAWTQVVNIKRDPFETSLGEQVKTLMGLGGAIAARPT
jgi:hypothetical protein